MIDWGYRTFREAIFFTFFHAFFTLRCPSRWIN